jgi:ABC-type multidrug transport system fused ATPase/permease subunit
MNRGAFDTLVEFIRKRWRVLTVGVVLATIAQMVGIPLALIARRMVNISSSNSPGGAQLEQAIWTLGFLLAGLALLQGVCRWVQSVVAERFAQCVIADLRVRMLDRLQKLSLGCFDRRAEGKTLIRFIGDARQRRTFFEPA